MLFCSSHYLVFLLGIFALYWSLPWARARMLLLLAASIYFYASWSCELAILVVATSMGDFLLARGIDASESPRIRRALLVVSLSANVGILIYFKYANFFLASLEQSLRAAGANVSMPVLQILAPIGISFYTFEAISYVVDVYNRKLPAERNPLHFLLFITFFPHLVSGPIVRGRDFLPQIRQPKKWNWVRMHMGVQLLVLGLFKKMAIGDRMVPFSDPAFATPERQHFLVLITGVIAFAVQVYCDFSGYSDMALGSAHLLGYKLTTNFRLPFLAVNVADLWRRWHISLSTWMRDYLYIPLGGSRCGPLRNAFNLVLIMTLGGLWHGAGWGFILWGFLHGVFLVIHRVFQTLCRSWPRVVSVLESTPGTVCRIALTFACFCFPLIFFRSQSVAAALDMIGRIVTLQSGQGSPMARNSMASLTVLLFVGCILASRNVWTKMERWLPAPALGACYAVTILASWVLAPRQSQAFLYFQF